MISSFCWLFFTAFSLNVYTLLISIPVESIFFTTDHLKNTYLLTRSSELIKFGERGQRVYTFSGKKFGKMTFADASNPFKILLFYPDFSRVITVDNTLSEIGRYDLLQAGINNVSAIARSQDNELWVFDTDNRKLKKFNEQMEVVEISEDVTAVLHIAINPNFMIERNNYLYVNDSAKGVFVFDRFAAYYKTIPITGLRNFQVVEQNIIYYKDGSLRSYNMETLQENEMPLPEAISVIKPRIERNRLYLLRNNSFDIYSY